MLETSINKVVVQLTALNEKLDTLLAAQTDGAIIIEPEAPVTEEPEAPTEEEVSDVSAKDVKKLAKELIEKKMITRDKVKKMIDDTGNHKISQMKQDARNTVYYSLMNVFNAKKK